MLKNKYNVLDLFSGIGGFSKGFQMEGFNIVEGVEFNEKIANICMANFNHDIKIINIKKYRYLNKKNIDIVIGGPPCQGFSIAGNLGRRFIDDPRNFLYKEFVRIVEEVKPRIFVMENVARLSTHNKGKTINQIIKDFERIGYHVEYKILDSSKFNTPQIRRRTILIGAIDKKPIIWPKESKRIITTKEAINDLPFLKSGENSKINGHYAMKHTDQMLKKMKYVKNGSGREDIPKKLRPLSGDVRKYIRYDSDKPSITITGDMRKVFHYKQNRALTPRELMRLQGFPDDFTLVGASTSIYHQAIGNAVPIPLAKEIAKCIKLNLFNRDKKFPKINYIGNKRKISTEIVRILGRGKIIADVFGGGGSFAWEAKKNGYEIHVNDALFSNYSLFKYIIENNKEIKINFNTLKNFGKPDEEFLKILKKKFFENEIEELWNLINHARLLKGNKKYFMLSLIRRAMIRKMPYSRFNIPWKQIKKLRDEEYSYLKYGRKRAYHNLPFLSHMNESKKNYNDGIIKGKGKAYWLDAFDFVKKFNSIRPEVVYLDPPYPNTMNKYDEFYSTIDKAFDKKSKFKTDFVKEFNLNFKKLLEIIWRNKNVNKIIISLSSRNENQINNIKNLKLKNSKFSIYSLEHSYKLTSKKNKRNYEKILIIEKINYL